jgi:hypothetical protein
MTICSWIAISNHCAFAAIATRAAAPQNECPFHSHPHKPAKQKDSDAQPCCKILRAVPTSPLNNLTRAIVDLVHVDLAFAKLVVFAPPKIFPGRETLDTGPPGTTSFVELIGSLRAHAPPLLA